MKALKPVLAILLPAILVCVLWQENAGESPGELPAVKSQPPQVESEVKTVPMNELLIQRRPTATVLENFRPPVREVSSPLPPNPYAAIPWEARLPSHRSQVDRGLYVMPVGQKLQH